MLENRRRLLKVNRKAPMSSAIKRVRGPQKREREREREENDDSRRRGVPVRDKVLKINSSPSPPAIV